jgi:hypothetical protein
MIGEDLSHRGDDRRLKGSGSPLGRFMRSGDGLIAGIASIALVLHFVTTVLLKCGYGYFIDEFYYIACSKRLAFGYVDHPPFSIWLLALSRAVLGDSLPALRLLPAVAVAFTIFLTGRMARMLGCGTFGQALAALAALVAPVYLLTGGYYSMNAFELLIWTACGCLLIEILRDGKKARWLIVGLLIGIGLEFKHTMFMYIVALLAGILLSSSRRTLRTRHFAFGCLIAFAILLPNLTWQMANGFPSLEFYRNAILFKNAPQSWTGVLMGQALLMNPFTLPLWLAGLWTLFFRSEGRPYRAFGWSFAILIAIMVASRSSRPDRIVAAYPALFAAGARLAEQAARVRGVTAAARLRAWIARAAIPGIAIGGILLAPISTPILPPDRLVTYLATLGLEFQIERGKTAKLPQWFADRFGWEERAAEVARVWGTLSPDERERAVIFARDYGQAASIEFYGPRHGLTGRVICSHNNYFLWGPGKEPIETLVTVLVDKEQVEQGFEDVRQLGLSECEYCMGYESSVPIYVARRPRIDMRDVWPELKHYE